MASQVIYSNLFSESRANVVALITTTNIPDSTISSTEFRKRIYSRFPDVKSSEFKGFPIIVVNHTDVDISQKGSVDGKSKFIDWSIEIEIFTSDRGYGSKSGTGATDMDTYSNSLVQTFMDKTNRNTLSTNSMKFSNATTSSVTSVVMKNERLFVRSIILEFRSRIQVSA